LQGQSPISFFTAFVLDSLSNDLSVSVNSTGNAVREVEIVQELHVHLHFFLEGGEGQFHVRWIVGFVFPFLDGGLAVDLLELESKSHHLIVETDGIGGLDSEGGHLVKSADFVKGLMLRD